MAELPTMMASAYASNTMAYGSADELRAEAVAQDFMRRVQIGAVSNPTITEPKGATMANPARRLVQVFIADPNENIPVNDCLLYSGEQKLTDLTDQELFFEIDVKSLLDKHNEKRVKVINKAVKDRTEHLEPAKIRDLKMVVTTVATF